MVALTPGMLPRDEAALCRACGSTVVTIAFRSRRGPIARCSDCGVFFVEAEAAEPGFDAFGLEPGDASLAGALVGCIMRKPLSSYAARSGRQFDVVTMWHVLESIPEPHLAIRDLAKLLEPDGTLILAMPNNEGRMFRLACVLRRIAGSSRLLDELFYMKNPNMHFLYYGPFSLLCALEQNGLVVDTVATLDAFDWLHMHKRAKSILIRSMLRIAGPAIAAARFTRRENLVVISRKHAAADA
jgi:SAM-dependent methyltransferase